MQIDLPSAAADFLHCYGRDVSLRWSAEDLAGREAFIRRHVEGRPWIDWSTEHTALELVQAGLSVPTTHLVGEQSAIVLAGPVVELLPPLPLFQHAKMNLKTGGHLIGVIPCLRDNSPENQQFIELAHAQLWPYQTAEDLMAIAEEAGFEVDRQATQFVPVERFKQAVTQDELHFKGFNPLFKDLEKQGYDPMKLGWGELRLFAG